MDEIKLTFCSGVGTVTGANFLLETEKKKVLIDCGYIQGSKKDMEKNRDPFPYDPQMIDVLIVTHAHMDHIGRIPKLFKDGFRGVIYSTPSTKDVARYMLEDSAMIAMSEARKKGIEPIYTKKHVNTALAKWRTVPYHEKEDVAAGEYSLVFRDAGHVLGSAIVCLKHKKTGKNIVFTGDLGNSPTPLLRTTEFIHDADYLIMESVYGDRVHENKWQRKEKLRDIINEIIQRKGTILMPVFSLEKTQVVLHELNDLIESGEVKSVPVFFDSPLGIKLTDIYKAQFSNFNDKVQERILAGDDIFDFPKLVRTLTVNQSASINKTQPPKIIIASSGMSEGGRIINHEKKYLPDPKNAILFLGYQVQGSLGRQIKEGAKEVKIENETVPIKAQVFVIDGYSSHKDSNGLVEFVSSTAPTLKKVFVVMGEDSSAEFLVNRLKVDLGVDAMHPKLGDSYILE